MGNAMPLYALGKLEPTLPQNFCWIAPNATVIGDVRLKEECSVWFGSTLRGDNEPISIGARTNIQENCVFHTDPGFPVTIGDNCTIGHKAMIHGCQIAANTLVGMGAIILNGAKIGKNCLIGAGALIPEGKTIPDNSLVMGVPGKMVRELDDDAAAMLTKSADIYVEKSKTYFNQLREI